MMQIGADYIITGKLVCLYYLPIETLMVSDYQSFCSYYMCFYFLHLLLIINLPVGQCVD